MTVPGRLALLAAAAAAVGCGARHSGDEPSWPGAGQDTWLVRLESPSGTGSAATSVVATQRGEIAVAGTVGTKTWVSLLDRTGKPVWERTFETGVGTEERVEPRLVELGDGSLAVVSEAGAGARRSVWVARLGSSGGTIWQKALQTLEVDEAGCWAKAAVADPEEGGLAVAGWCTGDGSVSFLVPLSDDGQALGISGLPEYRPGVVVPIGPKKFIVGPEMGPDFHSGRIGSVDTASGRWWFGPLPERAAARAGIGTTDGGFILAGEQVYDEQRDFWLGRFDAETRSRWSLRVGGVGGSVSATCFPDCERDGAYEVSRLSSGELVAVGTAASQTEGGSLGLAVTFGEGGEVSGQWTVGRQGATTVVRAVAAFDGGVVVAGEMDGEAFVGSVDEAFGVAGGCGWLGEGDAPVERREWDGTSDRREGSASDVPELSVVEGSVSGRQADYGWELLCP